MHLRFFLVLTFTQYFVKCKTECNRATFESAIIFVRLGRADYHERRITGCISPFTLPKTVNFLQCHNQTFPAFYEGAIFNLPNVVNIHFEHNKIKRIKSRAFTDLPQLSILSLINNAIDIIEKDAFLNIPILHKLDLNHNNLAFLDLHIFGNLPSVKQVILDHNQIEAFEPEWFGATESSNITYIAMHHNYLRTIPRRAFSNFKSLSTLDLTSNHIRSIHRDAFQDLHKLFILQLGDNRIQTLEDDIFSGLSELNYIHFFRNNLTYISDRTLEDLSKIQRVSLHGNPWQCGCYKKIFEWSRKYKIFVVTGSDDCYDKNTPSCVVPLDEETSCLEDRIEDLNAVYFESFVVNRTCYQNAPSKIM